MPEVDNTANSTPLQMQYALADFNIDLVKSQPNMECPAFSFTKRKKGAAEGVLEAPIAFQTLKMQTSHVGQKSYAIFDQCDGQYTVILHPPWTRGPSHHASVVPASMWEVNCRFDSSQCFENKPILCSHSEVARSPPFQNATHTQLNFGQMQECLLIDDTGCNICSEGKQGFKSNIKSESRSEFHEDTEEINALLSSDDELSSTGHSPSEGAPCYSSEATNLLGWNTEGRKRKAEEPAMDEVDDADSYVVNRGAFHTPLKFGRCDSVQFPISFDQKNGSSDAIGSHTFFNTERSQFCVSGPANTNQSQQLVRQLGLRRSGGLLKTQKNMKIKENVRQLRKVIPGGKLLDTAGVIGRTAHYVKCLQNKLRKYEAAGEICKHDAGDNP